MVGRLRLPLLPSGTSPSIFGQISRMRRRTSVHFMAAPYHLGPAGVTPARPPDGPTGFLFAFNERTPLLYDAAMKLLGDWKWYAALVVFVLFTALVAWLPRPRAEPAAATPPPSPNGTADMSSARPEPTDDKRENMLQYTVQDDDTVAKIARLFVTSEEELRWANHIPEGGEFAPGDKIWVPAP